MSSVFPSHVNEQCAAGAESRTDDGLETSSNGRHTAGLEVLRGRDATAASLEGAAQAPTEVTVTGDKPAGGSFKGPTRNEIQSCKHSLGLLPLYSTTKLSRLQSHIMQAAAAGCC